MGKKIERLQETANTYFETGIIMTFVIIGMSALDYSRYITINYYGRILVALVAILAVVCFVVGGAIKYSCRVMTKNSKEKIEA